MSIERRRYALSVMLVLATEIAIAVWVHDEWVRPLLGDSLAVVLVYLGLRTVSALPMAPAVATALTVAFALEFGQLFGLRQAIGLGDNRLAAVVMGSTFDPRDLLAYMLGAAGVVLAERGIRRHR